MARSSCCWRSRSSAWPSRSSHSRTSAGLCCRSAWRRRGASRRRSRLRPTRSSPRTPPAPPSPFACAWRSTPASSLSPSTPPPPTAAPLLPPSASERPAGPSRGRGGGSRLCSPSRRPLAERLLRHPFPVDARPEAEEDGVREADSGELDPAGRALPGNAEVAVTALAAELDRDEPVVLHPLRPVRRCQVHLPLLACDRLLRVRAIDVDRLIAGGGDGERPGAAVRLRVCR